MGDEAGFNKQARKICQLYHQAQELHEQGIHLISIHEKTGIQAIERDYPTQSAQKRASGKVEQNDTRHGIQLTIKYRPHTSNLFEM